MLVNLKDVLSIAEEHSMAVGAFNVTGLEAIRAVTEAADELGYPVIMQASPGQEPVAPLDLIGPAMVAAAKHARVPVCVHLDHCGSLAYMRRALEIGFTGAMYDGSLLSYEENVRNSKRAVEMCHAFGCSSECEIGSMGKRERGVGHEDEGTDEAPALYTVPEQAIEFAEATGLDALACSFGTVHGIYRGKPRLSFEILSQIRAMNPSLPLVMHGGSGVSAEDYAKAIDEGIRKVNYFTYGVKYAGEAVREVVDEYVAKSPDAVVFWNDMQRAAYLKLKETFSEAILMFANGAAPMC